MASNLSSKHHYKSVDRLHRSNRMDQVDNLQEELLKTKKVHAFASREASLLRTRVKILEKECKKKDQQIDELLREDQFVSKSEQRIETNALKRKVLQFERALREKTEEVAKLNNDREVVKAVDSRRQIEKLELECARLRKHLSESIPETEYFREKQQYIEIINQLTEENIEMRKIIGDFEDEQRAVFSGQFAQNEFDEEAFMHLLRDEALTQKQDAETYKRALNSLINKKLKRNDNRGSPWSEKMGAKSRQQHRKTSISPRPTQSNYVGNRKKKFPLRTKPVPSKINALRSKSIETSVQQPHGRLSRQFSDNHIERSGNSNCADVEDTEIGKEVLMPVYRKKRTAVMYRNAIDSDSSAQSPASNGLPKNLSGGVSPSTTETQIQSDGNEMPIEVYDTKGNIYLIQAEEGDNGESEDTECQEEINSEHMTADHNEANHSLMGIVYNNPQSEIDSLLDVNSIESESEEDQCAHSFIQVLGCHLLRTKMYQVRKETD
ncbi:hypothetical protein M3Y96_00789800 [Aphelenchoides besseyi]|nr:hypothetical protein M3Y96_00789800 [Aphelenchoides besseyi]